MTLPEPRPDLALREGYHSPQVDVPVRLNTNESPLPPPPEWIGQLGRAVADIQWNRYPDRSYTELRTALAELHEVQPDQVFCANGSNEVLQSVFLAYGGAGREAAVFEPTYALHSHIAHLTGTGVAVGHRRGDFSVDLDQVRDIEAAHRPAITFLCSPNNPTGTADDPTTVGAVLDQVRRLDGTSGLLVVDEAYGQFADWSALSLVADDVPLVVTRTFSKTWSMAAARLGYLIGPVEIVATLDRVVLPYHLDAFKQVAGRLAVEQVEKMERRVGLIVGERQRIATALGRLPVKVWPSQANFILFKPEHHTGKGVWEALLDRGVLVRDTSTWPGLEGCLRITVGTPEENDRFLTALEEALK